MARVASYSFNEQENVGAFNVVGPPGFEPGTKGFACSKGFPLARTISSPSAFHNVRVGCGTLEPVMKGAVALR